jgi:aromatic-L-amino-acid decarboxylase
MAIDPIAAIARICAAEGLWLHVDAAMAGVAAVAPEFRWLNHGLDLADSYCTNPHKWLGVNFDCDLFYVANRRSLINALSILPEYLRTAPGDRGEVIDYRDWQIPLGRRFRALKLWFVLRETGIEELRRMIRSHVALTTELATCIANDDRFELVAAPLLNLVVFAARGGDALTRSILERANATGRALFTPTVLDGRQTIRFCVGSRLTERRHVTAAWELLQSFA